MSTIRSLILGMALLTLDAALVGQERATQVYKSAAPSVFVLSVHGANGSPISFGTAFLVGRGRLATNWHVVKDGKPFLELGSVSVPVEIERHNAVTDLAIVKVHADVTAKPLTLASRPISTGESVFVIGNPEGLEKTISTGVLSGVREVSGRKLLQISAPISPGSSGGPVLSSAGEVVGITVSMLTEGQNLNFAVPVSDLNDLLTSPKQSKPHELESLLTEIGELKTSEGKLQYSADADSEYQKVHTRITAAISTALDQPGITEAELMKLANEAKDEDADLEIKAAEGALRFKPSAEANLLKGNGLQIKYFLAQGEQRIQFARKAADAFRSAIQLSQSPDPQAYIGLSYALEEIGPLDEAEANFARALDAATKRGDQSTRAKSLRGLVWVTYSEKRPNEGEKWFDKLVESGQVSAYDWDQQGDRQHAAGAYRSAALSYEAAATHGKWLWQDWCYAANSWTVGASDRISNTKPSGDMNDLALTDARNCVNAGTREKGSEHPLAVGHSVIAEVLIARGVFDQAVNEAKEATSLEPSSAVNFSTLADAFYGLRRFDEAISAGKEALALSDGKYSWMHFRLGQAYFELERWELARQSLEKASELDPNDPVAPYDVAMCLWNQHYYRDAITWLREVTRRDPGYAQKNNVESLITSAENRIR